MSYKNDFWTLELEILGMENVGNQLVSLAAEADPPFAIGVFGRWGSGKTSIMRYAMASLGGHPISVFKHTSAPYQELPPEVSKTWAEISEKSSVKDQQKKIRCVWFNPWQYQQESNPLVPLLHEIREQLGFWLKLKKRAGKTLIVSVEAGLEILGDLMGKAVSLGSNPVRVIRETGEKYERENFEIKTDAQRFSILFEDAVHKLLGGREDHRLVIFIDDLDRCEDEHILSLLEAIKLYLQTRYCVFVLGLDPGAIERALTKVKGKSSFEIREYLQKLFQAVIYVPTCENFDKFIFKILNDYKIPEREQREELAKTLAGLLEPNPRKVKNFLNAFKAAWNSHHVDKRGLNPSIFSCLLYLKLYHPDVYRTLEYNPSNFIALYLVLNEAFEEAVKNYWPITGFYMHIFKHILEYGKVVPKESFEDLSVDDHQIIEAAYFSVQDVLERHRSDLKLKEIFKKLWPKLSDLEKFNLEKYLYSKVK